MATIKKPFWKSFVTSLIVMISIIVVCGGVLAIVNDLCKVSDEERIQRAIDKIYVDTDVSLEETLDVSTYDKNQDIGEIKACYVLSNGDYLVHVTGKKGYSNGSITLYVSVSVDNSFATVKKTVLDNYKGQTLMSKLTDFYDRFSGKTSSDDLTDIVEAGTTRSSQAVQNAVYCSIDYVNTVIGG
ncbi:MAG: hypothetical protein J6B16_04510 [Clostridia bacterium]|nr:hypothetical protein [Clostridia bacterium]